MTTNELLRRYVDDRSEPAFEELVKRHIALVYSTALRLVHGNAPAAQDVAQTVFTDLARKAPRLIQHTSLAGWLYTSTRYMAAKSLRAEQRRRSYEQEAHEMNQILQSSEPDTASQQLRPLLDDAMHDLSASDREIVLLRYFESLPLAEVSTRLGLRENAARMRIERAVDRLRAALAKRGVTSTITALTAVLTGRAIGGVPPGLAAQVSRSALASIGATGGLTWGLLKLAGLIPGKMLVAAGGIALVAALIIAPKFLTRDERTSSATDANISPQKQAVAASIPSGEVGGRAVADGGADKAAADDRLELRLVANDTGKPIAGAMVEFIVRMKNPTSRIIGPTPLAADSLGVCEIPIDRDALEWFIVQSRTDGFVDTKAAWNLKTGGRIPQQYTLRLNSATPIGGQVVDENGKPVSGAEVTVQGSGTAEEQSNLVDIPHVSTETAVTTMTDATGRWRIVRLAKSAIPSMLFAVKHPDYAASGGFIEINDFEVERERLAGTYIWRLDHGVTITGIVVDSEGQPVPGARVSVFSGSLHSGTRSCETTNQTDGTFSLTGCKPGATEINAEARGFGLATYNVEITNHQAPLRLELRRGNRLLVRVVDTNGMPVPDATVRLNFNPSAVGDYSGDFMKIPGLFQKQTDADGRITWDSAPGGELMFSVRADGYPGAINARIAADGEEHLITLHAGRTISGNVFNAATGETISSFQIVTGYVGLHGPNGTNVSWGESRTFRDGTFRFTDGSAGSGSKFKFEADGYAPFVTRTVGVDEGEVSFEITLYPSVTTSVTVLSPDGKPATNASIGLEIPGANLVWIPGGFQPAPRGNYTNVLSANNAGQFFLRSDETITRVIAASPEGYAEATLAALAAEATMHLQPWGRIEGTLLSGGKPIVGRVLTVGRSEAGAGSRVLTVYRFNVETDSAGHFAFPQVPPGQITLFEQSLTDAFRPFQPLQVPALTVRLGKTTTVSLAFCTVTARLSLPAGVEMESNWKWHVVASQPQGSKSFQQSGDGRWVAEDLPAGSYTLTASLLEPATNGILLKARMQSKVSFTVPSDPSSGTLDLGEIVLQPVP